MKRIAAFVLGAIAFSLVGLLAVKHAPGTGGGDSVILSSSESSSADGAGLSAAAPKAGEAKPAPVLPAPALAELQNKREREANPSIDTQDEIFRNNPYLSGGAAGRLPASLREIHELDAKSLRSSSEQARLAHVLSAPTTFGEIKAILADAPAFPTDADERLHLAATSVIDKALRVSDLPTRELALKTVDDVVFGMPVDESKSAPVRELLLQDKAELLQYALATDPSLESAYRQRASSDPVIKRLLDNVLAYNKSQQAAANSLTKDWLQKRPGPAPIDDDKSDSKE